MICKHSYRRNGVYTVFGYIICIQGLKNAGGLLAAKKLDFGLVVSGDWASCK